MCTVTSLCICSVRNLRNLDTLDISENLFCSLPESLMAVKRLKKLDLSPSASLNSLHPGLLNLTLLQEVNCYQCFKLKSPPYAVCVQGLEAIIKYYRDLAKERSIEQPIMPSKQAPYAV